MTSYTWKRITEESGTCYIGTSAEDEAPSVVSIHKTRDGWHCSSTFGAKFSTLAQAKQGAEQAWEVKKEKDTSTTTKGSWKKPATPTDTVSTKGEDQTLAARSSTPATSIDAEKDRLHTEFLTKLAAQADVEKAAAAKTAQLVGAAREYGATWAEISETLGMSLAGAHKKYSKKGRARSERTPGEEPLF